MGARKSHHFIGYLKIVYYTFLFMLFHGTIIINSNGSFPFISVAKRNSRKTNHCVSLSSMGSFSWQRIERYFPAAMSTEVCYFIIKINK